MSHVSVDLSGVDLSSDLRIVDLMEGLGGIATRAALLARASRALVDRALRSGVLVRAGRGRYVLPTTAEAEVVAHGLKGILSYTSAAVWHGWEVKEVSDRPHRVHVTVPRGRRIARWRLMGVELHRDDQLQGDGVGIATPKDVTLLQCLRSLPEDEALVVADSALRHGDEAALHRAVLMARGPGAARVRRIAEAARGAAANPFESILRSIAMTVPGLVVEPQVEIKSRYFLAYPDLVDSGLGVVLEADSFAWHGDRAALRRDAHRYNNLVADGWRVLRFSWEQVMFEPQVVRDILVRVVARWGSQGPAVSPA